MAPPLKRGRPPKGARAMTPTERSREHRARKKPAADPRSVPSAVVGVGASEGASIPPPADFSTTWLAGRPLSADEADGVARFERLSAQARRDPADVAVVRSQAPRWRCDADVQLVARLKRVARGEWLDLCELAERLMRP